MTKRCRDSRAKDGKHWFSPIDFVYQNGKAEWYQLCFNCGLVIEAIPPVRQSKKRGQRLPKKEFSPQYDDWNYFNLGDKDD